MSKEVEMKSNGEKLPATNPMYVPTVNKPDRA